LAALALVAAFATIGPVRAGAVTGVTTDERRITDTIADEFDPAVSGDRVVYTSNRNITTDVFVYDLSTGVETPITTASGNEELADVAGDLVAYTDLNTADVIIYDLATGEKRNLTNQANAVSINPAISGQLVAWEDRRAGGLEIYAMDLATGEERRISNDTAVDVRPTVSGNRVAWERCLGAACDLWAYDWATGTTTQVTNTPTYAEHRPDLSGTTVVYDGNDPSGAVGVINEGDVHAVDLVTGAATRLVRPGHQINANLSGGLVTFEELEGTNYHVAVWEPATGEVARLTGVPGAQYLNDVDGHRAVYTDDRNGNLDIYVNDFAIVGHGTVSVSPDSYSFGDVRQGESSLAVVSVTNTGPAPLAVNDVTLTGAGYTLTPAPTLPAMVAAGATLDVAVTFTAGTLGTFAGSLTVVTDDPDHPSVVVPLTARSVTRDVPPGEQMKAILAYFDASVANGTLTAVGPGNSALNKRKALRNMLEASDDLIYRGQYATACAQLADALAKTDGDPLPPDFVAGPAAPQLAVMITQLRTTLGCR
jgi:beta propeller repeat protein